MAKIKQFEAFTKIFVACKKTTYNSLMENKKITVKYGISQLSLADCQIHGIGSTHSTMTL